MNFFDKVYSVVMMIPVGNVATYGQVARLAGNPRASRAVGYALHNNPKPGIIPCHRVVNRFGELTKGFAFGGVEVQASLLANEGVICDKNFRVSLGKYIWRA